VVSIARTVRQLLDAAGAASAGVIPQPQQETGAPA